MSDRILFSIGEALIDMIPSRVGCSFDEVPAFSPRVGGAPANVCAAAARLGGRSALLSQLGDDPFGHKIARALAGCGVERGVFAEARPGLRLRRTVRDLRSVGGRLYHHDAGVERCAAA